MGSELELFEMEYRNLKTEIELLGKPKERN